MHRVWAVSRNTIAQAVRMKVALSVFILLVVLLPLMSMIMTGDGTLKGKLQTFVSYGLSLTSLLLCLLTIIMSSYALSNDVKNRTIYLVATKPIRRFQIVCGKLLGIVIVDIFLLTLFAGIIYGLTMMIPKISGADEAEITQAQKEFFTARVSLTDPVDKDKINELTRQAYEKLQAAGQLPEKMSARRTLQELKGQQIMKASVVEVGTEKVWEFENIHLDENVKSIFVRFKYDVASGPVGVPIDATWLVGDYRQVQMALATPQTPIHWEDRSDAIRTFHEFEIDRSVIAGDGYLAVVFRNLPTNQGTIVPEEVQVLFQVGGFGGNYFRAVLLILVRLLFLAGLSVSLSTWLSFPVAVLVAMVIFVMGTVNGFINESFEYLSTGASIVYGLTLKPILWFLPQFDAAFNPTGYIVSGKFLSWFFLAKVSLVTVAAKTLLLVLFGIWIFGKRELARTTV